MLSPSDFDTSTLAETSSARNGDEKLKTKTKYVIKFPGGYSEEDTPVPIPNTAVKLFSADGTTG